MTIAHTYITAAKRHKYVCGKILDLSEFTEIKDEQDILTENQRNLLANVYYLTGYIIECSCCAAIYSFYPKLRHKTNLSSSELDKGYMPRNVAFSSKSPSVFSVTGDGNHTLKHFANFPAYFEKSSIPLLQGNFSDFDANQCYDLFENYKAELRYELPNSISIHYSNVTAFYKVACEIYTKVKKKYKL